MKVLRLLLPLALAVAVAIVLSGFGARFGVWDFRMGFLILRWGAYAGLAIAAVALVALLIPKWRAGKNGVLAMALVVSFGAAALPLYWLQQARAVPPINDITTDTANPPVFVALLPLRVGAPTPATYPGAATAQLQRAGYPDLRPVVVAKAPDAAIAAALAVARQMGWEIVAVDAPAGRIEATATTLWFGFNDDVVIRVTPDAQGSRVDIRSVSRVGRSDLGANARRIREFVAKLGQ
jgi:uncharacterized protein (DUF1499 family)